MQQATAGELFPGPGATVEDPQEMLHAYLDWYRDTLRRKTFGLTEAALRAPVPPLGWSPLGLVRHLGWVERRWMRWGFAAQDVQPYPPQGEAAEWEVPDHVPADRVWADYEHEVALSRSLYAGTDLRTRGRTGGRFEPGTEPPTLGRILFHLLQEYARHVGHLDIARELIDGTTGE
jgi:uncharacterized damage-inducible protein DinB